MRKFWNLEMKKKPLIFGIQRIPFENSEIPSHFQAQNENASVSKVPEIFS